MDQLNVTRAIVLGGGGVTGMAWEVGMLAGLLEVGIDLYSTDTVIGTSAGSFVGAALASGYDMNQLFLQQLESRDFEIPAVVSAELYQEWVQAFQKGGAHPELVGAEFGKIAQNRPEPISVELRRFVLENRLVTTVWPAKLKVTAIQAETGQLYTFSQASGISLIDAVAASGAVPGISPLVHIDGEDWIDGGMVSPTNTRLADAYDRIIILAPMPGGYGLIPGASDEASTLQANGKEVVLVTPDPASIAAIGNNPYDPTNCASIAMAARAQSKLVADSIRAMWSFHR